MKLLSHADLERARGIGDGPIDAVIEALGDEAWIINAALRHLHRNGDPLPEATPAPLRTALASIEPPAWLDMARCRRAQRWASAHLFHITVALFCASLPTAYGAARGARVLAATGRMRAGELDERINATAQFVLDVVQEDGFGEAGAAIRAIQKVRLVHAAVRTRLVKTGMRTDEIPINQEDMLGTLFGFSVVVLRAAAALGVEITAEQAEDYYHLWRGAGSMLGIREELLPDTLCEARDASARITRRHLAASSHGCELMAELLAGMERHVPHAPSAPRYLVRYLAGEELADLLGVPAPSAFQEKLALLRLLPSLPLKPLRRAVERASLVLGRPLLEAVITKKLRGRPATFALPTPS